MHPESTLIIPIFDTFQLSVLRSGQPNISSYGCLGPQGCDASTDPNCVNCQPAPGSEHPSGIPSKDASAHVAERSLCPWRYNETYAPYRRYPPTLVEAACVPCASECPCQAHAGSVCEPVHVPIPILINTEQEDDNGTCVYNMQMYNLQTGCTCAKIPLSSPQA